VPRKTSPGAGPTPGQATRLASSPDPQPTTPWEPERRKEPWESYRPISEPETDPLTEGLTHLGLSLREATMFHVLLSQGPSTARDAILGAALDRATGYRILSRLCARGLVTSEGHRPQRFVALDATKLFDRVSAFWRDEVELHRVLRDIYLVALHQPIREAPNPRPSLVLPWEVPSIKPKVAPQVLPGHPRIGEHFEQLIERSKEEILALLRPTLIPEPLRTRVRASLADAVRRKVRVRLVVDCKTPEFDFLTGLLRENPEAGSNLELRFFAPQPTFLAVVDGRSSMRCIHSAPPTDLGPDLGLASEDMEFVQMQTARFHSTWRDAVRIESLFRSPSGAILVPADIAPDLRRWVERTSAAANVSRATDLSELGFPQRNPVF
jgi:sugar-specific transcriptional regulator TrmB